MGYSGLDSWEDSDHAADFVHRYSEAKTTVQKRKLIDKELKYKANPYNTEGCVNIVLAMEGGVVRNEDLTLTQKKKLCSLLQDLINNSSRPSSLYDEEDRVFHNKAYKRFLKFVKNNN